MKPHCSDDGCSCERRAETWSKQDGRWICQAKTCTHWLNDGGCKLGKISLTCDNNGCEWNKMIAPGVYGCTCMDVHLDAAGRCFGQGRRKK